MKEFIKGLSDKASNYLDSKGLANPVEVINEELGGETREESKVRREKAKDKAAKEAPKSDVPKKMAKGGSASSLADGCCIKGKTRVKMI